jgi:hypothetical protein
MILVIGIFSGILTAPGKSMAAALQLWERPGITAALGSGIPELQQQTIRYLAQQESPLAPPETAWIDQIQAILKTRPPLLKGWDGVAALSNLSVNIQAYAPQLLQTLQNANAEPVQRAQALQLLVRTPQSETYRPLISERLLDPQEHIFVRTEAALALGRLGPASLPTLLEVLRDRSQNPRVRGAAALGLSNLGNSAKPYITEMGDFLRGTSFDPKLYPDPMAAIDYSGGQVAAAQSLSQFGAAAKAYLPDIFKFVKAPQTQPITDAHGGMAAAFAQFGPPAYVYIPQLMEILQQPQTSGLALPRAIEILGQWGAAAQPAVPILAELARQCDGQAALAIARLDREQPRAFENTVQCIKERQREPFNKAQQLNLKGLYDALEVWAGALGGLGIPAIAPLLNIDPTADTSGVSQLDLYRLSGGRTEVLALLKEIDTAKSQRHSREQVLEVLPILDQAWDASPDLPLLRNRLAETIGELINSAEWQLYDLPKLRSYEQRLQSVSPPQAAVISRKLSSLWRMLWGVIGAIGLVWLLLFRLRANQKRR